MHIKLTDTCVFLVEYLVCFRYCNNHYTAEHSSSDALLDVNFCVRGAPLSVADRLNGQQTGVFSWRPVFRSFQEDRPIPPRPYPELRIREGSLMIVSKCTRKVPQSSPNMRPKHMSALSLMHTIHHLHPYPTHPILVFTYYEHVPTVTNSSVFHAQL